MKTCQYEMKCEYYVEKHFFEKCHMTSNDKKMKYVLCNNKHKTWFNICEYKKNAKISKFYKINKNVLIINYKTNDDFSKK